MIELLCIETHPDKVVIAGNVYFLISDKPPCKCKDLVDVGIPCSGWSGTNTHYPVPVRLGIGELCHCKYCLTSMRNDGIWWMGKWRFREIASETEVESKIEEKKLQEA